MPPSDAWSIYHIRQPLIERVRRQPLNTAALDTPSVFYGGKGLALLRGGRGPHRHGVQLFFGPEHNHGQFESLTWMFFARGAEWSLDPGYFNTHLRFGWTEQSVAHQSLVINQTSVDPTARQRQFAGLARRGRRAMGHGRASPGPAGRRRQCYERLIAQAQQTPGGELAYWLDVGRVAGGRTRDDSFHTQMTRLESSVPLPSADAQRPSLFGHENLGRQLRADMRLKNYNSKPFGWMPPGEGYAFLGSPREIPMPATVRLTFSQPGYAKGVNCRLVADLLGAEGRKLIVADGPQLSDCSALRPLRAPARCRPACQRLCQAAAARGQQRNRSDSQFRENRNLDARPDRRGKPKLPVEAAAWCVAWKDGRRDLWIVGGDAGRWAMHVGGGKLPKLQTDARVALVRLDRSGKAHGGRCLRGNVSRRGRWAKPPRPGPRNGSNPPDRSRGKPRGTGRSVGRRLAFDRQRRTGHWPSAANRPPARRPPGACGASTSHRAVMDEVTAVMGRATLEPQSDKPGWYRLSTSVSRFLSMSSHGPNVPFAVGRAVYQGSRYVGRVTDVGPAPHR